MHRKSDFRVTTKTAIFFEYMLSNIFRTVNFRFVVSGCIPPGADGSELSSGIYVGTQLKVALNSLMCRLP